MRRLVVTGALVALVAGSTLSSRIARADAAECKVKEGAPAPKFSLSMADGSEGVSLSQALSKGVPVVLGFWAYFCVPCARELPMLERLSKELGSKATFVLIHAGPDEDKMKARLAELGVTIPCASDDTHAKEERYCVTSLPRTFVIDTKGIVRKIMQVADEKELRAALADLGVK